VKAVDDPSPFDLGFLEINKETNTPAGGAQVIEALRCVFVGEAVDAFQLHQQRVFDEKVCEVSPTQ
jgi:hypothetical protein